MSTATQNHEVSIDRRKFTQQTSSEPTGYCTGVPTNSAAVTLAASTFYLLVTMYTSTMNLHSCKLATYIETSESQATHFIDRQCLCEEKATKTEWQETRIHTTELVTA